MTTIELSAAPFTPHARRFSRKARLAAVFCGLMLGLIAAELGLRFAAIDFASPYVPDEHCGARLPPNHRFRWFAEGHALVTTNSDGHRDREHAKQKPPEVVRIAVLGDSFAEALQVDGHETFWSVMEGELARCDAFEGRPVEVLNFGVSGYGTTQELQMLRHYVWDYQPDIVLVAFLPGNDVRNNSRALETDDPVRPFFAYVDGAWKLDLSFRENLHPQSTWLNVKIWLVRHVRLLSLAYRCKENLTAGRRDAPLPAVNGETGLDMLAFAPPKDAAWSDAWAATEVAFGEMASEVRVHGARLVVASLNNAVQLDTDSAAAAALRKQLGVDDLDFPDRRLTEIGQAHGFPVVLLTPRMRELFQRDRQHFHGFPNTAPGEGHWNKFGHRVAGELLARDLCALVTE